jgi:hypothetical protein
MPLNVEGHPKGGIEVSKTARIGCPNNNKGKLRRCGITLAGRGNRISSLFDARHS